MLVSEHVCEDVGAFFWRMLEVDKVRYLIACSCAECQTGNG